MDPSAGSPRSGTSRFPRPRGDGPAHELCLSHPEGVSPPTRGWTLERGGGYLRGAGFPAHAGMDPKSTVRSTPISWFPRPRGDGPCGTRRPKLKARVSPPTRGWTRSEVVAIGAPAGFPAHAGMDPCPPFGGRILKRFPRPRGDGPFLTDRFSDTAEVSPPTRGWTPRQIAAAGGRLGFPAHAGMDLTQQQMVSLVVGFPRPRGDGPARGSREVDQVPVSPPTRGWTLNMAYVVRLCTNGFPAHAGMDLE